MKFYCACLILCLNIYNSLQTICWPCALTICKSKEQLRCRGGLVPDVCNCCYRCAKLEGEHCGGKDSKIGHCDNGLYCKVTDWIYSDIGKCVERFGGSFSNSGFNFRVYSAPAADSKTVHPPYPAYPSYLKRKQREMSSLESHMFSDGAQCITKPTTFCHMDCTRCWVHNTPCNPNKQKFIRLKECALGRK